MTSMLTHLDTKPSCQHSNSWLTVLCIPFSQST